MEENSTKYIWIFQGENSRFPSAVFYEKKDADDWINKYSLSGILTQYPIGISVYDWAIQEQYFTPKNDMQKEPKFMQNFSGGQEHYHYENGVCGH
jgi:hypothetical protein